jgi:hypothetical protein
MNRGNLLYLPIMINVPIEERWRVIFKSSGKIEISIGAIEFRTISRKGVPMNNGVPGLARAPYRPIELNDDRGRKKS